MQIGNRIDYIFLVVCERRHLKILHKFVLEMHSFI